MTEKREMAYYSLKLAVCLLATKMREDITLFAAEKAGRRAMSEASRKAYLCGMNNDIGLVELAEDVWYSADDQRYMPLVSSIAWKAEMDGYSFFDPGEATEILWETEYEETPHGTLPKAVTDYDETKGHRPGGRSEIMNVFAPLEPGPYQESFNLDPAIVQELMDHGVDIINAMRWATDCFHYENAAGAELDPMTLGYEGSIEDAAMLVDLEFSRGYCDAEDSWDSYLAYVKELACNGPVGVCHDRARYMRQTATQRNDRFIRELSFIAGASDKAVRSRYAWAKDPAKRGAFWRTVDKYHSSNPEPGLSWLTRSHTILINFAYRRRLGIKVSDGLTQSAVYAAENITEQMKKHCDINNFNLADIEGHICGHTEYFEYLGKYYASK